MSVPPSPAFLAPPEGRSMRYALAVKAKTRCANPITVFAWIFKELQKERNFPTALLIYLDLSGDIF
jgi:hypothetical protein